MVYNRKSARCSYWLVLSCSNSRRVRIKNILLTLLYSTVIFAALCPFCLMPNRFLIWVLYFLKKFKIVAFYICISEWTCKRMSEIVLWLRLNKKARNHILQRKENTTSFRYEIDKKRCRKGIHWFIKYRRNKTMIVLGLREKPKHGLF
jgi:hypothetical protein